MISLGGVILNLNWYLTDTLDCKLSEKNQFMIEGDHKIKTVREAPNKKLGVQNDRLGRQFFFTRPKK